MKQHLTFFRFAVLLSVLATLQVSCKTHKRTSSVTELQKQEAEIRKEVPDMNAEQGEEGLEVYFKPTVLFAFDKAEIPDQIKFNLDRFADVLKRFPDHRVLVRGHTDDVGTASYNQTLSEERARTVKDYLVTRGVSDSKLKVKGYGNTVPRYSNDTEIGRARNRRVEFLILGK